MDNTRYTVSEREYNEICDAQSTMGAEIDFIEHWSGFAVENEVLRGFKLREEKPKCIRRKNECEMMNIESVGSSWKNGIRKTQRSNKLGTISCVSSTSRSPTWWNCVATSYRDQTQCPRPLISSVKPRCLPSCPLRIVQLAAPSKRQCIETWRNKSDVLPAFMLERLRQHIMDERPIVHLTEAITCFKRRKPKSSKHLKRRKKYNREEKLKNDKLYQLRKFCTTFGNKVAQKLMTSKNLNLSPGLKKMAKIIQVDILNMMQSQKFKTNSIDKIMIDVTEKIAVWIATVIEEASLKLLEEDLAELEEEEGPALDFLDYLIDNVVINCNVLDNNKGIINASSKIIDSNMAIDSSEYNNLDTSSIYININYETGEVRKNNETESVFENTPQSEHFEEFEFTPSNIRKEINKILNSLIFDHINETELVINRKHIKDKNVKDDLFVKKMTYNKDFTNYRDSKIIIFDDINDKSNTQGLPENFSVPSNSLPLNEVKFAVKSSSNSIMDINQTNKTRIEAEPEGLKSASDSVSGLFESFTEGIPGEINETVHSRKIDLDTVVVNDKPEHRQGFKSVSKNNKHNLTFAPPNNYLLSEADESWPEDIVVPVMKATTSVNKSVTSLGKILEKDDKLSIEIENNNNIMLSDFKDEHETTVTNENERVIISSKQEIHDRLDPFITEPTPEQMNEKKNVEPKPLVMPEKNIQFDFTNISYNIHGHNLNILGVEPKNKPLEFELMKFYKASNWNDVNDKNRKHTHIYKALLQKNKVLSAQKFDYKVHFNTAPSWVVHNHSKDLCEDKSIWYWCKELEWISLNLELWNKWLEQRKTEINEFLALKSNKRNAREQITFKKNIEDAILWTKHNRHVCKRLKTYKFKGERTLIPAERTEVNDFKEIFILTAYRPMMIHTGYNAPVCTRAVVEILKLQANTLNTHRTEIRETLGLKGCKCNRKYQ